MFFILLIIKTEEVKRDEQYSKIFCTKNVKCAKVVLNATWSHCCYRRSLFYMAFH